MQIFEKSREMINFTTYKSREMTISLDLQVSLPPTNLGK